MALRRLQIEGFGHFSDFSLTLDPGLTVVFGPNEAGKTTLAAFMRYVLFDHEQHRVAHRAQALAGGRLGGRVELDGLGSTLRIERFDAKNAVPTVRMGAQAPQTGDAAIRTALGGVDASLFRAVFSFSLDDLSGLNALNEAGLRERLFMGALAGAGRDVSQAIARLDQTWTSLYRPRSASEYTDAVDRMDSVRTRLAEAQQALVSLTRRQPEAERLAQAQRQARDAERAATEAAIRWRAVSQAAPHHAALQRTLLALAEMPAGLNVDTARREELQSLERGSRDAEMALVMAARIAEARRAEIADRPAASPYGPFEAQLLTLEARLRDLSPAGRKEREQAAAVARGRVEVGLRDLGLADARALASLDLSIATSSVLRDAARAVETHRQRTRAVETLQEAKAQREAVLVRREAEFAGLPRDAVAQEVSSEVESLVREAPGTAQYEARLAALGPSIAGLEADLARAASRLGDFERATDQPAERAKFAAEIREWRTEHFTVEARAAQWSAELETRKAAVAALETPGEANSTDEASLDALAAKVLSGVDDAVSADVLAAAAERRAQDAGQRARVAIAALGSPFTEDTVLAARLTPAAREVLRAGARALTQARTAAEAAQESAATAEADVRRLQAPLEPPKRTMAELDSREDAIELVESAVRARDEAALRSVQPIPAGASAPRWATAAGLIASLLLLVAGVVLLLQSAIGAGAVVMLVGLFVGFAAWAWLRPMSAQGTTGTQARSTPTDDAMSRASSALAMLGLSATTGTTDLAGARTELRRERQRTEAQTRLASARAAALEKQSAARSAGQRWETCLAEQSWPSPVAPEALESILAEVLQVRDVMDAARREATQAQEARARFTAFCTLALPLAAVLTCAPPTTADSVRALADALRRSRDRAEERARASRTREDRLVAARHDLERAEAEHRSAAESLTRSRKLAEALDERAERLGVPASVGQEGAVGWLEDAAHAQALAGRLADLLAQRRQHQDEVERWRKRLAYVATQLELSDHDGKNVLALAQDRCRVALRRATEVTEAEAECRRARSDLGTAIDALVQATLDAESDAHAPERWAQLAARAGHPSNVPPDGLDAFLKTAERVAADAALTSGLEDALEHDTAHRTAFADEVQRIARAVGAALPEQPTQCETFLRQALVAVTHDKAQAEENARLQRQCALADDDYKSADAKAAALRERLILEYGRLGVPNFDALERLVAEASARAQVEAEAKAHRLTRDAALGVFAARPEVVATLDDATPGAWEVNADAAEREAEVARASAETATIEATRIGTQLETAASARDIPELQMDLEAARADVARARQSMVRVALAKQLLQRTLDRYREAHQPAILKTAGQYLSAATEGIYTGVEVGARDNELVLVDAQGGRRESRHLSRGTTELLYLILRFGLAGQIGAGSPLPLILDDVLVNLDADRAAAVSRLLAEVATRHQVLLLTCRAETRDLLLHTVPNAASVDLPRFAGRTHPIAPVTTQSTLTDDTTASVIGQITAALRATEQPLTRAELQARLTLVPEAILQAALQQAREQGSVQTQGAGRGTRYLVR